MDNHREHNMSNLRDEHKSIRMNVRANGNATIGGYDSEHYI